MTDKSVIRNSSKNSASILKESRYLDRERSQTIKPEKLGKVIAQVG